MFSLFKKKIEPDKKLKSSFEIELVGSVLAYEIAKSWCGWGKAYKKDSWSNKN